MLFHSETGADAATFEADVRVVLEAMKGQCWNGTTFGTAEKAAAGSNLFFLVDDWEPIVRTSSTNPGVTDSPAHFVQYGGRSQEDGVRAKLYLFEAATKDNAEMRIPVGDDADVAAVVEALNVTTDTIGSISGSTVVWYAYANTGQNDYITHRARRS
jgi:hypothetical protein